MTETKLKDTLRSIVSQYGFEQVDRSLREIQFSDTQPDIPNQNGTPPDNLEAAKPKRKRAAVTAPQYVAKMNLSSEKEPAAVELARRFENKSFLPTFGDISNFCQVYGIAEPASRSRASAIPRVFKFIAAMEADDAQKILDYGMFSGPSRLGPIADAIRAYTPAREYTSSITRSA